MVTVTATVGHLTSYWNIPHIVWRGNSLELSDKTLYTTLVRTNAPLSETGEAVVALFKRNNWRRIGLLYMDASMCSFYPPYNWRLDWQSQTQFSGVYLILKLTMYGHHISFLVCYNTCLHISATSNISG